MIRRLFVKALNGLDRKLHDLIWLELSKYDREERRKLYGGDHGMFVRIDVLKKVIKSLPLRLRVLETTSFHISQLTQRLDHGKN
jgi:hypothetical protein